MVTAVVVVWGREGGHWSTFGCFCVLICLLACRHVPLWSDFLVGLLDLGDVSQLVKWYFMQCKLICL